MTGPLPDRISLALQGGGAHSAFTWGVIDHLLEDGRVEIDAISASSGGAIIATVLAQGLLQGGKEGGREALTELWRKVSIASGLLPIRMNVVDKFLSNVGIDISPSSIALDYLTRIFSPSQFNFFDVNPLRDIVGEMVDFDVLNQQSPIKLFINTTQALTGKSRIFTEKELSLEAVMASACLPFIFKTVQIDGEPYWDGSFSGAPPLSPLTSSDLPEDIVLVQVHPSSIDEVPATAADILDRTTEISFNAVLMQDIMALESRNMMIKAGAIKEKPVYLHRIEAQDMLASVGRSSKLNTDWSFLTYLHDLGQQAATDWLDKAYGQAAA